MKFKLYKLYDWLRHFPTVIAFIVSLYLIIPIIIIAIISFSSSRYLEFPPPDYSWKWYESLIGNDSWLAAFTTSFEVAIMVTILSVFLGTIASISLTRIRFKGKNFLYILFLTPLIIPVIVTAVSSYFFYSALGLIETKLSLVLSHTALALPLVIFTISASLSNLNRNIELAAQTLGAHPVNAFFKVTLPLIKPGIIAGALLSFITSFDEPVIAIFIAGTRTVTLPKKMWDGIRYEIDPTTTAVSVIIIVFSSVLILSIQLFKTKFSKKHLD